MIFSLFFSLPITTFARSIEYETLVGNFSRYESGLYQSALDAATDRLYVTSSLGHPPYNLSDLLSVNPVNLEVVQDVVPPVADNKTGVFSVYGMSLDQAHGRIWATHARQQSVGFFHASDLSIGHEWPEKTEIGPREVWADEKTGLAYVGSSMSDCVYVYSADHPNAPVQVSNITEKAGKKFFRVMAFTADKEERVLYTASMVSNLAAAINLTDYSVKIFDLGDVQSPSGVALDTKRKYSYVSNQKSNNTVVVDTKSGKIIKTIENLGGPLSTAYDALYDVVYIACRLGHKVAVIDASDFSPITELSVGTPNHVSVGITGEIFVTDKSEKSALYKFTPINNTESVSASPSHLVETSSLAVKSAPAGTHAAVSTAATQSKKILSSVIPSKPGKPISPSSHVAVSSVKKPPTETLAPKANGPAMASNVPSRSASRSAIGLSNDASALSVAHSAAGLGAAVALLV